MYFQPSKFPQSSPYPRLLFHKIQPACPITVLLVLARLNKKGKPAKNKNKQINKTQERSAANINYNQVFKIITSLLSLQHFLKNEFCTLSGILLHSCGSNTGTAGVPSTPLGMPPLSSQGSLLPPAHTCVCPSALSAHPYCDIVISKEYIFGHSDGHVIRELEFSAPHPLQGGKRTWRSNPFSVAKIYSIVTME